MRKGTKLCYLAIPYSFNPEKSFRIANEVSADLMQKGFHIFSPISHSHPINVSEENKTSYEFWMYQDLTILDRCDEIIFVVIGDSISGMQLIEESKGCIMERMFANARGIPISYYYYDDKKITEKFKGNA